MSNIQPYSAAWYEEMSDRIDQQVHEAKIATLENARMVGYSEFEFQKLWKRLFPHAMAVALGVAIVGLFMGITCGIFSGNKNNSNV